MLYYLSAKNIFKVSFCESGKGQSHTLMSNDEHDKRQWVNAIRNAINAVKKTSTSSLKPLPLPLPLRPSTSTSSTSSEEDIWQTGCDIKTSMLPTFEWPCFPWIVWELNSFKNKGHTLSHNLFELKGTHVSVETLKHHKTKHWNVLHWLCASRPRDLSIDRLDRQKVPKRPLKCNYLRLQK